MQLCHCRMLVLRAYPREAQEMVFDAHEKAFACFKGAWAFTTTAVDAVFAGKERTSCGIHAGGRLGEGPSVGGD